MEKESNGWETVMFTILLPVMSVGCSVAINYFESKIGFLPTLIVLVTILVMVAIALYLGSIIFFHIGKSTLETHIDLKIKAIQEKIAESKIMNGICKEEQLALMEKTCLFEEIWLISPDLLTEINSGIYAGVISKNLKKGTKYKYFVPDTEINRVRVKIFKKNCGYNKRIHFFSLNVPNVANGLRRSKKVFISPESRLHLTGEAKIYASASAILSINFVISSSMQHFFSVSQ